MLTQPGDIVLDIFAGSNTTGQVAEVEARQWLAFELSRDYIATSAFRFLSLSGGSLLCVGAGLEACVSLLLDLLGRLAFGDRASSTDWRLSSSRTPSTSIVASSREPSNIWK